MIGSVADWLHHNWTLLLKCVAFFGLSLLVTATIVRWRGKPLSARGGFDFNSRKNNDSSGPKIGATVNFKAARAKDGHSLADDLTAASSSMIVVIDLHCQAWKAAHDQMLGVRDGVVNSGINYYVVMLGPQSSAVQYFDYADSLHLAAKSFVWRTDETPPPASLTSMVVPSHLLLNSEGVVIDKWPGTDQDPTARQRMINQITADARNRLPDSMR